jgi:shikimate dehydrogenase
LYKPWPTLLAQRWSDAGGAILNGFELLLYQGIDQLALVSDADVKVIAEELRKTLVKAII